MEEFSAAARLRALIEPEVALSATDKLRLTLMLCDTGREMQCQNFRRQFPEATENEIHEKFVDWLQTRPGAEYGDAEGIPVNRSF